MIKNLLMCTGTCINRLFIAAVDQEACSIFEDYCTNLDKVLLVARILFWENIGITLF